jgi:hypothetical protein
MSIHLETVQEFNDGTLKERHHYHHIVVTIAFALSAVDIDELISTIRCSFIMFKTINDPAHTKEKCVDRYNQTISSFWVYLIWQLVQRSQTKDFDAIVQQAEEKGFFNKELIYKYMSKEELDTNKAKAQNIMLTEVLERAAVDILSS